VQKLKIKRILILITFYTATCACFFSDIQKNYYADFDAASSSGAIDRGWIPEFLPRSASAIYEKHDLDTNDSILFFTINPGDVEFMQENCSPIENAEEPDLGAKWWPDDILSMDEGQYQCADGFLMKKELSVYFWRS